jgi:hypothetical protein
MVLSPSAKEAMRRARIECDFEDGTFTRAEAIPGWTVISTRA